MTDRFYWKDAERTSRWLEGRQSDLRTLTYVARFPFVHEYVIERLVGLSGGASIYRSLARLREAGPLATIKPPLYAGRSQDLYYVTDLGLATLALSLGVEVGDLARKLHLTADHLVALLPHLDHLVSAYDLLGALAASREGCPVLLAWERPFRRRYYRPTPKHPVSVRLPAYTALSWYGEPGAFFLLPDRGGIPLRLYRPMLDHLFVMRRTVYSSYRSFPILVIATWSHERTSGWKEMLEDARRHQCDMELPTWFTHWGELHAGLVGIERLCGFQQLDAAQLRQSFRWQRLVPRRPNSPIPRLVGDALFVPQSVTVADGVERLALRLSPADHELLDLVAEHPYLTPNSMAAVLGGSTPSVRRRRNRLLEMGVMRLVGEEEIGERSRMELPELTVEGLGLVAARRGLSLPVAVRELGLIGGGSEQTFGPRRRLLLHLTHTLGADDLFIRLYKTAQRRRRPDTTTPWSGGTTGPPAAGAISARTGMASTSSTVTGTAFSSSSIAARCAATVTWTSSTSTTTTASAAASSGTTAAIPLSYSSQSTTEPRRRYSRWPGWPRATTASPCPWSSPACGASTSRTIRMDCWAASGGSPAPTSMTDATGLEKGNGKEPCQKHC